LGGQLDGSPSHDYCQLAAIGRRAVDVGGWIEADSLDDALSGVLEGRAGWQLANQRLFDAASAHRTVSDAA